MAYDNVIKSVGYNQHEILYNIIQLHNDGKPYTEKFNEYVKQIESIMNWVARK